MFASEFVAELYIDEKKQSFKDLGYKRFSLLSLPGLLLSRIARSQAAKVLMHILPTKETSAGTSLII